LNRKLILSALSVASLAVAEPAITQQPPDVGIRPLSLTEGAYVFDTAEQHKIRAVVVVRGLQRPFSLALLTSGDALISERSQGLRLVHNATGVGGTPTTLDPQPVAGVPTIENWYPNCCLHDVVPHPLFAQNKWIYFTFNKAGNPPPPDWKPPQRRESRVALMRGVLSHGALTKVEELFVGESGGVSSGSRIAFAKDGTLYMSTGSYVGDFPQRLDSVYGKVLHLTDDGKAVADNPFVGRADARPEIFSLGHRDQLGLAVHPVTGAVFNAELGPIGGDELNLILPGRNYGWPKVSFGKLATGAIVSDSPVAAGIEPPILVWLPSIAPTGLTIYTGDRMPAWKGNLFIGSARRGETPGTGGLERVVLNEKLQELRRETLLTDLHQRIRDVRQGPDGLLYVITDENDGALLRIEPAT
jgi:glucose/arabinose dehydrogenase